MNTLFDYVGNFHCLSLESMEALSKKLKRLDLPSHSFLVKEGSRCNHIYFMQSGCLRGFYNLDGKEATYWFAFENNFVTSFYSFNSGNPSFENIQALEDSVLWCLSHEELHQLYNQYPDIDRLGRISHEKYYMMLQERFISIHFKEAKERYTKLLDSAPHILQRVPLGYIATYLGISQETLSRIRGKV